MHMCSGNQMMIQGLRQRCKSAEPPKFERSSTLPCKMRETGEKNVVTQRTHKPLRYRRSDCSAKVNAAVHHDFNHSTSLSNRQNIKQGILQLEMKGKPIFITQYIY